MIRHAGYEAVYTGDQKIQVTGPNGVVEFNVINSVYLKCISDTSSLVGKDLQAYLNTALDKARGPQRGTDPAQLRLSIS